MSSKKIRDIVVKVGEYQDRNTGETKGRFENVGALMQNDDEAGSFFIMIKRTFNPAGVPKQDDRESILLSCYVPKDQREQADQPETSRPRMSADKASRHIPPTFDGDDMDAPF